MAAYTVGHAYSARRDGRQFGPWTAGEVVELDADDAQWVERDSPGAVTACGLEREARAGVDRQHRGGRNRGA